MEEGFASFFRQFDVDLPPHFASAVEFRQRHLTAAFRAE